MRGIWRKAVADLRSRPLQAALLFLVVAAAAATLSLALNVQSSASKPYERLRQESNGADVWVSAFDARADLSRLRDLPSVSSIGEPYPVSFENYGIREGEKKQQIALVGLPANLPDFDHPVLTRGRWLNPNGANEIVVDSGAATILKLDIGQSVELLTGGGNQPFTVVGFAVTASRNPAPVSDPAFAYVLPETLRRLEPDAVFGASFEHRLQVGVRLTDPSASGFFFSETRSLAMPIGIQTWQSVREDSKQANQFDVIFLNVFSVFALFAAGLIVANTIAGQVLSQLRDTGILKAIGFTPRQITLSLLLQNLSLSLVASIAGVLAGLLVAPFFLQRSADVLGVPATPAFNPMLLTITVLIVMVLVAFFTLVPAWRAGRVSAIAALTSGSDGRGVRPSRLASLLGRLGVPRVGVVGVKDLSRRPVRTSMTIAALVLAVITATFSLGIEATFRKTMSEPTVIGGPPYDVLTDRDTLPDAEARAIFDSHADIESYLVRHDYGGRVGNYGFEMRGYEGDLNNPRWALRKGRMPSAKGEAALSTQLAQALDADVGDILTVALGPPGADTSMSLKVVGRFSDVDGEGMALTADSLPADAEITDYLIRTKPGTDNRDFANSLIAASNGNLDPEVLDETITEIRDQFRPVLFSLNVVLFFIAGLNLLASLLLSIRERRRDFAVLKTLGFTPSQVAQSVFAGSVALSIAAVVIGIPVGLVVTRVVFDLLASAAGIGTGVGVMPGALWLAPLLPGAILIAVIATVLPARRAAAVQVAEALRYE